MPYRIEKEYNQTGQLVKEVVYNQHNKKIAIKLYYPNGELFGEITYLNNGEIVANRYIDGVVIEKIQIG